MKFLIHSNAPHASTGYGVQVAQLAERLHDDGHHVAVSATYGQNGQFGKWRPKAPRNPDLWPDGEGIRIYPAGWHLNGLDVIHSHANHFFNGDPDAGWVIVLGDVWSLADNPLLRDWQVAAWAPVDHYPVPPGVVEFFRNSEALPIAMSDYGQKCFRQSGLDPDYVPLAVNLDHYKPTPTLLLNGEEVTGRQMLGLPEGAFVVGMVAMNKDPDDRKSFDVAMGAFSVFHRKRPDSILYVHSDPGGMGTSFSLHELANAHQIPQHAIKFPDVYALQVGGFSPEQMAATYTAFDVLLSPSKGEGFCVPLVEAQACGTPVIASDFSAQSELVGSGWKVPVQPHYNHAQHAFYGMALVNEVAQALEECYLTEDLDALGVKAQEFAEQYGADYVYEKHWRPLLALMEAEPEPPELDRDAPFDVDVIVPLMRPENLDRLVSSFQVTNPSWDRARIFIVTDEGTLSPGSFSIPGASDYFPHITTGQVGPTSYAEKVNLGLKHTDAPWVLLVGDDVEFHPGWFEAAERLADRYDVIGTNDSEEGRTRNRLVADGVHADHFFVRRSYVQKYGASLDGPGVLAPTCYRHWFVDREIVGLAIARNTFAPCLDSRVIHHHPGYDGREDLREADATYMLAVDESDADLDTWRDRVPLIEMQRTSKRARR